MLVDIDLLDVMHSWKFVLLVPLGYITSHVVDHFREGFEVTLDQVDTLGTQEDVVVRRVSFEFLDPQASVGSLSSGFGDSG